jgi:hypothetical protein
MQRFQHQFQHQTFGPPFAEGFLFGNLNASSRVYRPRILHNHGGVRGDLRLHSSSSGQN